MVVAMTASTLNGIGLDTVYAESEAIAAYEDSGSTSTLDTPKVVKEITADSATSFKASWTAVEGADAYVIDVSEDLEFKNIVKGYNSKNIGNNIECTVSGSLVGGTTYYYRVRAIDSSDNYSDFSETVTVNPKMFEVNIPEDDRYTIKEISETPVAYGDEYIFQIWAGKDYSLEKLTISLTQAGALKKEAVSGENAYQFKINNIITDMKKEVFVISGIESLIEIKAEAKKAIESEADKCNKVLDDLKTVADTEKQKLKESSNKAEDDGKQKVDDAFTESNVETAKKDTITAIRNLIANMIPEMIDNIGTVAYDKTSKEKIEDAQLLFDSLPEDIQGEIPYAVIKKLDDAVKRYAELEKEAKDAAKQEVDGAAADAEKRIDSLTKASDAQKAEWKGSISDKADSGKTAIDAAVYGDAVISEKDKAIGNINNIFVDITKALIDAIGDVKNDNAAKEKIEAAKEAFGKLSDEEKEKISAEDKKKLDDADALVAAEELNKAKQEAKKTVEDAVGEIDKRIDSFTKIPDTQKKEWKDKAEQMAESGNEEIDAENTVKGVDTVRDNTVSSIQNIIIDIVKDLINEIGEVKNDDDTKGRIEKAKETFGKLTDEEKEKIPEEDKKRLADAEDQYSALVDAEEINKAKQEAKKAVGNAVEEVGKGIDSLKKVTEAQKKAWKNEAAAKAETGNVKIDAEDTVKGVDTARDNAVSSIRNIIINIAKDLINEIGEVKKDDASKDRIDAAKEVFDKLTDAAKEKIPEEDKKKLSEAEKEYNALAAEEELQKRKDDAKKKVGNAVDAVNKRIDALKNAPDEQKKVWKDEAAAKETAGNKEIDAQDSAKGIEAAKDNTVSAIYNIYVDIIKKLINDIGEVKNDDASKKRIDTAKEAFDSLTDTEKQKVPADLTKKLEEAQIQYAALVQDKADPGQVNTNTISLQDSEKQIVNANTDKNDPANSQFSKLRLKAAGAKKSIKLSWTKVNGADGYIIYGARCGKKMKRIKTVAANKKTYTVKKLAKGKYYKYIVSAYKLVDGKKSVIATSKSAHAATSGGKYGNPTKVIYSKSTINLKKGSTKVLKPKMKTSKKIRLHIAKFRYESTNPSVVTVDKKGKLNAKQKGTGYVYIYAQNGYYKKIKVKVK